jgi:hypothetical protein
VKFEGFLAEWDLRTRAFVKLGSPDIMMAKLPVLGGPNVGKMSFVTAEIKPERNAKRAGFRKARRSGVLV